MEPQESVNRELDGRVKDLFEQAHRDPVLKRELLSNPREVAERFKVRFSDEEVQQLQKLAALSELAGEIKFGRLFPRPPIFYPIDFWRFKELEEIISHLVVGPRPGPIFYPVEGFRQGPMAMRAYNPGWVTYPGDEGGGGGGGGRPGGGGIPGPIFYPAGLRNLLAARLAQILQVRQRFGG